MNDQRALIALYRTAAELLQSLVVDRDALVAACTIGNDLDTAEAGDRGFIEQMDDMIARAKQALADASEVLDV